MTLQQAIPAIIRLGTGYACQAGLHRAVMCTASLGTTRLQAIPVISTERGRAWGNGKDLCVIAKRKMIARQAILVTSTREGKFVSRTGTGRSVTCSVNLEMVPWDIIYAMQRQGIKYATRISTVPTALSSAQ